MLGLSLSVDVKLFGRRPHQGLARSTRIIAFISPSGCWRAALDHVLQSDDLFFERSESPDLQMLWLLVKAARDYISSAEIRERASDRSDWLSPATRHNPSILNRSNRSARRPRSGLSCIRRGKWIVAVQPFRASSIGPSLRASSRSET